jgi:hypothetical protein
VTTRIDAYMSLHFHMTSHRHGRGLALTFFIAGVGLTGCHGSSHSPGNNAAILAETGPVAKIVPIARSPGAVVALFPDGNAFYSPDGFNLGSGGSTVLVNGGQPVADVVAVGSGVDVLLANGAVFYSPDGKNLAGGGATVSAYGGMLQVGSLTPVGDGIDAVFTNGYAYYSPDGLNLGGGGRSLSLYEGGDPIRRIVAVGPGDAVVTLFASGTASYSPDNHDIGGGGSTISAAPGAKAAVTTLVKVGGGVLAAFADGEVFLSPDGENLAGGGATISVAAWDTSPGNGPFAARDSAHGATFLGHLWFSGGFAAPTNSNSCYWSCSFFDLWSSADAQGRAWNASPSLATATTPDPRDAQPADHGGVPDVPLPTDFYDSYSALTVWNGQLTAIGSTVWRSVDGVTWLRNNLPDGTPAEGPLADLTRANENSRALILGASLFFLQPDLGGDVFQSTDPNAATWTYIGEMASSGYTPRCGEAAFALLGKMWVMGGGACDYSKLYNDIWSSPDGVNWTRTATPVAWSARMWPCIALGPDGIVWLAGGYAPTDWNNTGGTIKVRYGANHSDVWYSRDAVTWKQLKADAGSGLPDDGQLEPRHAATCYVTPDASGTGSTLVIIAGTGGSDPNDANAEVINSIRALPLPAAAELP